MPIDWIGKIYQHFRQQNYVFFGNNLISSFFLMKCSDWFIFSFIIHKIEDFLIFM